MGNKRLAGPFQIVMPEDDPRQYLFPLLLSLLLHGAVFAALFFGLGFHLGGSPTPTVISVSMVSLGDIRPDSGEGSTRPVDAQAVRTAPTRSEETAEVSIAPTKTKDIVAPPKQIKIKKSLKKKTFNREKAVESAVQNIEENMDRTRPESVSSAIDKLREKVRQNPSGAGSGTGGNPVTSGPDAIGGGGSGRPRALTQLDIYKAEIASRIQQNWAFSEQLAGDHKGRYAIVAMEILRNGTIRDVRVDRRSGNQYLDDSAYRAVRKADPLPPLPESYRGTVYKVGFRFTPSGIKN
jgi:colicin import membrane protein